MSSQRDCGAVLIVEDDSKLSALLEVLLREDGFETVVATDGGAALDAVAAATPAAVVLDVNLPGRSGYEVCHELRRRFGASLPILFVSGDRVEPYDRVAGLLLGADDYLVKPFAPEELVVRVRALVTRALAAPRRRELTARELEVLTLLAEGLEQADIAARLEISPKTVATHIERTLAKLGVRSRAQAVAVAFRESIVAV